jgi:hypothetical protein
MQPMDDADEYAEDEFEDNAIDDDSPLKNSGGKGGAMRKGNA